MKTIMGALAQLMWLLSGMLVLLLLIISIPRIFDVKETIKDARHIMAEANIQDMRQAMVIIEKELDNELLSLMIEKQRGEQPLKWTPGNWRAFLDFCGRAGYEASDYNWQRYIAGQLSYR